MKRYVASVPVLLLLMLPLTVVAAPPQPSSVDIDAISVPAWDDAEFDAAFDSAPLQLEDLSVAGWEERDHSGHWDDVSFTIVGSTDEASVVMEPVRHNMFRFSLTAVGTFDLTATGTAGTDLTGNFSFDERGLINGQNGRGANYGVMTMTASGGQLVVLFSGRTEADLATSRGTVTGNWTVLSGSGPFAGWQGRGRYFGEAGSPFTVTFDGRYYIDQ